MHGFNFSKHLLNIPNVFTSSPVQCNLNRNYRSMLLW